MFKQAFCITALTTFCIMQSMENKSRHGLTIDVSYSRGPRRKTPPVPVLLEDRVMCAEKRPSPNELEHGHIQKRCLTSPSFKFFEGPDAYGAYAMIFKSLEASQTP